LCVKDEEGDRIFIGLRNVNDRLKDMTAGKMMNVHYSRPFSIQFEKNTWSRGRGIPMSAPGMLKIFWNLFNILFIVHPTG
jgi:hypothetical protein